MRSTVAATAVLVALAGCGGDDDSMGSQRPATAPASTSDATGEPDGTKVRLRGSDFGPMLWGPNRQAIYIFENDRPDRSRCYGECARAWPPVLTRGKPVAGRGVRERLLDTTRRRNGKRQVTYDGKPLYYYAHEGAGEVLCHDVFLNGGYWWVVGRNGERRP